MPRNYVRKTFRGTIDPRVMIECARKVVEDRKSVRSVAREFGVNYRTLSRFCTRVDINQLLNADEKVKYVCGYKKMSQVLTDEEETMLIDYLVKVSDMLCGLSSKGVRQLAYEFAVKRGKKVPLSWNTNKQAGPDWLYSFMKRHSNFPILGRTQPVKSTREMNSNRNTSKEIVLESLGMDLSFETVDTSFQNLIDQEDNYTLEDCDPLQQSFKESQNTKIDETDSIQSDRQLEQSSSNNNITSKCNEFLSIKVEVADLPFAADELIKSQKTVNPVAGSLACNTSLDVSIMISERDLSPKNGSSLNNISSVILPSSWSITELPVGEVYRFCLSFIITVTKDNIVTPVLERCILIDAKRKMVFKARNKTVDNEKLKLPRVLDDLEKLPAILKNFESIRVCEGLGKLDSRFLKDCSSVEDCVSSWRHNECPMLLLDNKRCNLCNEVLKSIQKNLAKLTTQLRDIK